MLSAGIRTARGRPPVVIEHTFAIIRTMVEREGFRWRLADDDRGQPMLFPEEALVDRHVGIGEYRGLEFLHVNAKRIINPVPAMSRMGFRFTINAYRGCSHACSYCVSGDTSVLMADGRVKPMRDVRVGDRVVGTERQGRYRRYVSTEVLDHWSTIQRAYRVLLKDGTELITSGNHRFLSNRGWKHVADAEPGSQRPHLTHNNALLGPGTTVEPPAHDVEYRRGYLTGMIRGDGTLGAYRARTGKAVHAFRLALTDFEAVRRTYEYLAGFDVQTNEFQFAAGDERHAPMTAIRTGRKLGVRAIRDLIEWPHEPDDSWRKGFLAGLFDAEGSYGRRILRIFNTDASILGVAIEALRALGYPHHVESRSGTKKRVCAIRLVGGLPVQLRFFLSVDPSITRKRTFLGQAIKNSPLRRVRSVTSLGIGLPMFDVTTGTGDFIANGVVSHNCFARPTHEYLGLGIGEDFERKLVVKVNAVEKVRAELRSPKWGGELIAMGTNTDPYQRAEGKYHLTRGIVEALGVAANPFSILTKSTLILRDLDLLVRAAERTEVNCAFSIGTLDEAVWKRTEPGTPHPRRRVEAVKKLNDAGISTGVLVAPIIPGLSDRPEQLEEVTAACLEAGATSINAIPLHLRPGVKEHFLEVTRGQDSELARHIEGRYRGAYLPKAEQEAITALVKAAKARHPSGSALRRRTDAGLPT